MINKRKLAFLFAAGFILCVMTSAVACTTMYVYTSDGNSLNLRDMPSLSGGIITTIPYGAAVTANDTYDPAWYSVTYNGYSGYAMSCYLSSSYIPYSYGYYQQGCVPLPTPAPENDANININININISY